MYDMVSSPQDLDSALESISEGNKYPSVIPDVTRLTLLDFNIQCTTHFWKSFNLAQNATHGIASRGYTYFGRNCDEF